MMINYFMLIFSIFLLNFINKKLLMIYFQNIILIMFLIYLILNKIMFFSMKFYHFLFIDYYSFYLMLLIFWIMSLMFMSMIKMKFKKLYILNLLLLLLFLLMTFNSLNYFMFYLFFEISMIPTLLLIVGWGGQFERIEASLYMFMYTLFGSLPMMIIILKIYYSTFSLNIIMLNNLILINNIYMYMYMLLAFLIKIPMFFFHLWLPKAHVEAPISGSMILASIMLKLGSYGILRTMMIMESICLKFNYMIMSISLMGSMFISLICIQQIDMKIIIAYSSVVHMGMLLSSLLTMNLLGNFGSLMMMIAHGLCSSNLFCLLNLYYERLKSRSIYLNKGMMNLFPSLSFFWFMICIFNMASPPSLNMFSEILMINSLLNYSFQFIYLLMILSFFNIVYMMYFYSKIQHGTLYKNLNLFMFISMREYLLMFLHLIMLFYLILMF